MSGTARSGKTHPRSFVLGGSHIVDAKTGNLREMTKDERDDIAATCSRYASELCTKVAIGAGTLAAAAAALILFVDLGRQGGGTRKAKKSKRKARATRSRKH